MEDSMIERCVNTTVMILAKVTKLMKNDNHKYDQLERALCGDANPRRLVRQNAAGAPAAMQDTFLL